MIPGLDSITMFMRFRRDVNRSKDRKKFILCHLDPPLIINICIPWHSWDKVVLYKQKEIMYTFKATLKTKPSLYTVYFIQTYCTVLLTWLIWTWCKALLNKALIYCNLTQQQCHKPCLQSSEIHILSQGCHTVLLLVDSEASQTEFSDLLWSTALP